MRLSQVNVCSALYLLYVVSSFVNWTTIPPVAAKDPVPLLSRGSRHRISVHRTRQAQQKPASKNLQRKSDEIGGQRTATLWHKRLLAQKQKKNKDKVNHTSKNKNGLVNKTDNNRKKEKLDEKTKMKKLKQEEKTNKASNADKEGKVKVIEATADLKDLSSQNSGNNCICYDDDDDGSLTEDSWRGDTQGLRIGFSAKGWDFDKQYGDVLKQLRADIIQLFEADRDLVPKCLRLAFHDCMGGCDGCIDATVLDNRGLAEPVEHLFPLVEKYQDTLSRGDIWSYCAVVAADMAVGQNRPEGLHFFMHYVGRRNCDGGDEKGFGGPVVEMYSPDLTNHEIIDFFYKRFGLDPYETVVLMGVHSAAVANRENLGFGNIGTEDGWIPNAKDYKLSNLYYRSMLESVWEIQRVENRAPVPNRYQWYSDQKDLGPIMLTADMSLMIDTEGYMTTDDKGTEGLVMCRAHKDAEFHIEGADDHMVVPECPIAKQTRWIVEELAKDDRQFLFAFVAVLNKMIMNGYGVHDLSMSKSGKQPKGKSGKGRKLFSSDNLDEHSIHGGGDSEPKYSHVSTQNEDTAALTETSATKKKEADSLLLKKMYGENYGNKKWCSCQKPVRPTPTPTPEPTTLFPTYYPTYSPTTG